jgi:hypothetical protein
MAFWIRKAMGVLAIVAIAGGALLGVGCGSGNDGSERAVEWNVERQLGPNQVRLSAVIEPCNINLPLLEDPIIEYKSNRVYIELRQTPEELEEGQNGCLLGLLVAHEKITFERDLDELVLYDASTDPPEQRWPRERCWPNEPC